MKIGIVCAMHDEWASIGAALASKEETTIHGRNIYINKKDNNEIYIIESGIGKVAAAMATTILVAEYHVDLLISSGVTGAISKEMPIASILLSTGVVQYDIDTTPIGDPLGLISPLKEVILHVDETTLSYFELMLMTDNIPYKTGIIGSGDKFIANEEEKNAITKAFGVSAFEMEFGAVAEVAKLMGVPFIAIKSISDNADSEAGVSYEHNKLLAMGSLTSLFTYYFNLLN